jgi:hypothetical protein
MSKFYWAAVVPAFVAVACIILAYFIMQRPLMVQTGVLPFMDARPPAVRAAKEAVKASAAMQPPASPPFLGAYMRQNTTTSAFTLPSDHLHVPRPPARDAVATCIDVGADLKKGKRIWRLNFSSECRDNVAWPTPAAWRLNLSTPMRNVSSVTLRSVALHASEYTVDVWNRAIDISVGGGTYAVTVPAGNHITGASLATAVQAAIVSTHPALVAFTVAYTALTDTITISESTPAAFTLCWRSGANADTSMWKTLGYDLADTTSVLVGARHVAVAPGRIDLMGVLAIDVFADELEHSVDGPIGRVQLQRTVAGDVPVYQSCSTCIINEAHSFWPVSRLSFLTLRFMVERARVNQDGTILCDYRPYAFNGRNNTLRIDFGCTEYVNPMEQDVQLDPGMT